MSQLELNILAVLRRNEWTPTLAIYDALRAAKFPTSIGAVHLAVGDLEAAECVAVRIVEGGPERNYRRQVQTSITMTGRARLIAAESASMVFLGSPAAI